MEVIDNGVFDPVLDSDEKIIKIIKPVKCKLFTSHLLFIGMFALFFMIFILFGILIPSENGSTLHKGFILLPICAFLVFMGIYILLLEIYYKNLYFAYSNKRIIIRSGIFGIDFKNLDMAMIGATSVNVSVLDKLLKKDSGTIAFGSTASPMISSNSYANSFKFGHVKKPYELYKEIKLVIDNYKKNTVK